MGLGLFGGGRSLTEFLCQAGAAVTVTDLRDADTLSDSIELLKDHPIQWTLGEHHERDFLGADRVFVNPAVPRSHHLLRACVARGIPLDTEMNLFFKLCRGRICGITGSNGKTTTSSLTGTIFRNVFETARLGGNLGHSLLSEVDVIGPDDWVILELSSFQLEDLGHLARRPEISLVTNLSPNHLNRHKTYRAYREAKRTIIEGSGVAVLNGDDTIVRSWATRTKRRVTFYGRCASVTPRARGVWVIGDEAVLSENGRSRPLFSREDLQLVGDFNLVNAAGAAAAALEGGCPDGAIIAGVRAFKPIEHRLELFCEQEGIRYYNDSIATTPESTLCALSALGPNMVLIAGGSEKGSSFSILGRAIVSRTRGLVLIGDTAPRILKAVRDAGGGIPVERVADLEEAVDTAARMAQPGDAIALSPACASYDMFLHFAERGERFKELVLARHRELA